MKRKQKSPTKKDKSASLAGTAGSPKRPPVALMSASAAMAADCKALHKLTQAGMEVVVVQDCDFEKSLRIIEKVRRQTKAAFVANTELTGAQRPVE